MRAVCLSPRGELTGKGFGFNQAQDLGSGGTSRRTNERTNEQVSEQASVELTGRTGLGPLRQMQSAAGSGRGRSAVA